MRSIAVVCIRAVAAHLILVNVSALSLLLPSQLMLAPSEVRWHMYVGSVVMIAIGFVMMAFSKNLAALLLAGTSPSESSVVDGQALLQAGTIVLGLYLVGAGIPQLVGAVSQYFVLGSLDDAAELRVRIPQHNAIGSMIGALTQIAIGCLLIGIGALRRKPAASVAA